MSDTKNDDNVVFDNIDEEYERGMDAMTATVQKMGRQMIHEFYHASANIIASPGTSSHDRIMSGFMALGMLAALRAVRDQAAETSET